MLPLNKRQKHAYQDPITFVYMNARMANTMSDNDTPAPAKVGAQHEHELPTRLHRELSQQELEVARQLIEHSQSVPVQQSSEAHEVRAQQQGTSGEDGMQNGTQSSSVERLDMTNGLQSHAHPPANSQKVPSLERQAPASAAAPNEGQKCR